MFPSTIAAFPRLFIQIVINKLAKVVSKLCSTDMLVHYFACIFIQTFDLLRGINVSLTVMFAKYEHGNEIRYLHE